MGWWADFKAEFDADHMFAYTTLHKVVLRDRVLGFTDLFFKALVVLYIVVWVMLVEKAYLKRSPPAGTTRMSLLEPDYSDHIADYGRYCTNHGAAPVDGATGLCVFQPATMAVSPFTLGSSMLIHTRVRRSEYSLPPGCTFDNITCKPWELDRGPSLSYFLGGIDYATMFVDHSVREPDGDLAANLASMKGKVFNCDGDVVRDFTKKEPDQSQGSFIRERIMTVAQLFEYSSGTKKKCKVATLDTPSGLNPSEEPDNTIRYDGAVMVISINYDNTQSFNQAELFFEVRVMLLPDTEYKLENVQPYQGATATDFTVSNAHGILVVVTQTGQLGHFDMATVILQLTAALTLLAVSTKITDVMAAFVLPHKDTYRKYMFTISQDFSDINEGSSLVPGGKTLP